MSLVGWTKRPGGSGDCKAVQSLSRTDADTVIITFDDTSTETHDFSPACPSAASINFRHDIDPGFQQQSVLNIKLPQEAGFAAEQVPATLMRELGPGVAVDTFSSGTSNNAQDAGIAQESVLTLKLSEISGFQQQQYFDYTGTKWVTTATNIGPDNWTNVTNAEDTNDGTEASRSGQALSSTDGQIRCQFSINPSGEKDDLTIDLVELRFYVRQTGTALNNGGLELDWRIGSAGGWTNLATYTNNQNFNSTPDSHDITGSIASWANIRDIEARVRCNLGTGTSLVTDFCDAVLLHVEASLVE